MLKAGRQPDQAFVPVRVKGMVRLYEFTNACTTAATVGRMVRTGGVKRLGHGLYQLSDAPLDAIHSLAADTKPVGGGRRLPVVRARRLRTD